MPKLFLCLLISLVSLLLSPTNSAQDFSSIVIFQEPSFPSADTAASLSIPWQSALPSPRAATANELQEQLQNPASKLFILPYGSAFPESAWSDMQSFLRRGGNLLVLGGRPLTRAACLENGQWRLRDYSARFICQLSIDQYQTVPGSGGLAFESKSRHSPTTSFLRLERSFLPRHSSQSS